MARTALIHPDSPCAVALDALRMGARLHAAHPVHGMASGMRGRVRAYLDERGFTAAGALTFVGRREIRRIGRLLSPQHDAHVRALVEAQHVPATAA